MIFFIIVRDIKGFVRPYGLRFNISSLGSSVAKAKEARVSMIRLTHNIWIAFNGESCEQQIHLFQIHLLPPSRRKGACLR